MRVITLIALLLVLFMGVAYGVFCATGEEPVDMKGQVVGVCYPDSQNGTNTTKSVLVQGAMTDNNQTMNISVKISEETIIMEEYAGQSSNCSFENIQPGQAVEIRFTGPVLQSYPPQTTASQIIILK
jgi:co-chaperonin GroES (HSP10)